MKKNKSVRQDKLTDFISKFAESNKDIQKSLKLFGISNAQYKQAVKPAIKVYSDNCTKFSSVEIHG